MNTSIFKNTKFICSLAILINFVISYLMLFYQQPFNVDGILYLSAAKAFLDSGMKAAMAVYPWPFYSMLIAVFSKLTSFSLESSAYFVNAILTGVLVAAFIMLVKELGGDIKVQYFALLVILLFPYLNNGRDNILRDFGYCAFLLTSLLFFMRYMKQSTWCNALSWGICIVIATLFRIEGGFLFLLTPIVIFIKPKISFLEKVIEYLKINTLLILAASLIAIFLFQSQCSIAELGRVAELFNNIRIFFFNIADAYAFKKTAITNYVLLPVAASSAAIFIFGGLAAIFFENLLRTLGFVFVVVIVYTIIKKWRIKNNDIRLALYSYVAIIFLTLIFFLMYEFFLTQRYVFGLCLILMLSIPFGLELFFDALKLKSSRTKKFYWGIFFIGLLTMIIHGFGHTGHSKKYIVEAGYWIKQNTVATAQIYSNSAQVSYYTHRNGMRYPEDFIQVNTDNDLLKKLQKVDLNHYDYLVVQIDHDDLLSEKNIVTFTKKEPIKTFYNKRNDKVLIFKLNDN